MCRNCGRGNFDSPHVEKVEAVFEVRIGDKVNQVCGDCLAELAELLEMKAKK
jgi:hypothetical protein